MSKQFLSVLMTLGLLAAFAVTPADAQGVAEAKAQVPFDFIVGEKTLPAGEYTVSRPSPGRLRLDGEAGTVFTLALADIGARIGTGKLVFNRYGKRYFLSRVDMKTGSTSFELSRSPAEKKLRRTTSDQESLAIVTRSER